MNAAAESRDTVVPPGRQRAVNDGDRGVCFWSAIVSRSRRARRTSRLGLRPRPPPVADVAAEVLGWPYGPRAPRRAASVTTAVTRSSPKGKTRSVRSSSDLTLLPTSETILPGAGFAILLDYHTTSRPLLLLEAIVTVRGIVIFIDLVTQNSDVSFAKAFSQGAG